MDKRKKLYTILELLALHKWNKRTRGKSKVHYLHYATQQVNAHTEHIGIQQVVRQCSRTHVEFEGTKAPHSFNIQLLSHTLHAHTTHYTYTSTGPGINYSPSLSHIVFACIITTQRVENNSGT